MVKRSRTRALRWAAVSLLMIVIAESVVHAENQIGREVKDPAEYLKDIVVDTEALVIDKQLLDVYVRIMRYQTAGQDIINYFDGSESKPEDYLTIAVSNVRVGKKEELSDYLKKIYGQQQNEVLQINRQESCPDGKSCRLAYSIEWVATASGLEYVDPSERLVGEYLTYDIKASYKGKSVAHAGLILHYESDTQDEKFFIYDGIIPQINVAALDRLPLAVAANHRSVRAFRQSRPREAVKKLKAATVDGQPLESEDEGKPIGYLPGDDENMSNPMEMTMLALIPCAPPPVLSGPSSVTRGDNATFQITGLVSGAVISDWKFVGTGTVNRSTNTNANSWSGKIAENGTVSVKVVQSGNTYNLSRQVTANPRSNFQFTAVSPVQVPGSSLGLPQTPQLGSPAGLSLLALSHTVPGSQGFIEDNGPNHHYRYVVTVNPAVSYTWGISGDLENPNSAFYLAQCGNYNPSTNIGYISGAKLKANDIYHESANTPNAHYYQYRVAQDDPNKNVGIAAESVIGLPGLSLSDFVDRITDTIDAKASLIFNDTSVEPCSGSIRRDGANGCHYDGHINFVNSQGVYRPCNCGDVCMNDRNSQYAVMYGNCQTNCQQFVSGLPECNPPIIVEYCDQQYDQCFNNCVTQETPPIESIYQQCVTQCFP